MNISDVRQAYRAALVRQMDHLAYILFPLDDDWNETILGIIGYPNRDGVQIFTKWDGDRLIISDRGRTIARLKQHYGMDRLPLELVENGRIKMDKDALFVVTTAEDALEDYLRFRNVLSMMTGAAWYVNLQRAHT